MRVLLVHPSALMYSEIFLRLEPLGLERVAAAVLADGHEVRLIDLQVHDRGELERQLAEFRPQAVGFSLNYLANVPEVVDLARDVKVVLPGCTVFAGGHSVSFVAEQVLAHSGGAIDVVLPRCSRRCPTGRPGRWPGCPAPSRPREPDARR
jgi:hopanoid C-3 methylase